MKIVEYNNANDVWVEFQDKYKVKVHTSYKNFEKGLVKNPYDREIYNVGFIGIGKYKTMNENKKITPSYKYWSKLLRRCYDPYFLDKNPTYRDCVVCKEWHNYQNFAKWYEENYYETEDEKMQLDKDILIKGNKIYSPYTCCFVPQRINCLFLKRQNERGIYPIGVCYHNQNNKLFVKCNIMDNKKIKSKSLGCFPLNRPFQAFYTYKIFKENYIKQVADEYKDLIPKKIYEAMYRYEVEIND